jgi:hypothetical protein
MKRLAAVLVVAVASWTLAGCEPEPAKPGPVAPAPEKATVPAKAAAPAKAPAVVKAAAPAPAKAVAPAPAKAAAPKEPSLPEGESMNKVLGDLSADQIKKINDLHEVRGMAFEEWDDANGAKLAAAKKAETDARAAKDDAALAKAKADVAALGAQREAVGDKNSGLQFLTPPQKLKWSEFRAMTVLQLALKPSKVELSDAQQAQARGIYAQLAKDIPDLEKSPVRHATYKSLQDEVVKKVLTDAQRAAMAPPAPAAKAAPAGK